MAKTAQELKDKSRKILEDPKLIEIVNTAPTNKDGRVNLTRAYENTFAYIHEGTKDLKKAKEFAVAARWLAMLKRDYLEEFESFVVNAKNKQTSVLEPKSKLELENIEIELVGDIIFPSRSNWMCSHGIQVKILKEDLIYSGIRMVADLLEAITKVRPSLRENEQFPAIKIGFGPEARGFSSRDGCSEAERLSILRDYLIQILEEKFGIKIKVCGNCANNQNGLCFIGTWSDCPHGINFGDTCKTVRPDERPDEKNYWQPKV